MKILILFLLSGGIAIAQTEPTQAEVEQTIKLDQMTVAIAQEFAKDPRFEVTETPDSYQVKPRTEPTVDPVDPEEKFKVENIQGLINFSFGKGSTRVSRKNLELFAPQGDFNTVNRNSSFHVEMSVRAPVKGLKRLLLGFGIQTENAGQFTAESGTHTIARGGSQEINESFFATWDVLVLRKVRGIVSTGYHYGSYTMLDLSSSGLVQTFDKEHSALVRWSQLIYSSKDKRNPNDTGSEGMGYYAQLRRSQSGTTSLNFGLTLMYGADWPWLRRDKTK